MLFINGTISSRSTNVCIKIHSVLSINHTFLARTRVDTEKPFEIVDQVGMYRTDQCYLPNFLKQSVILMAT